MFEMRFQNPMIDKTIDISKFLLAVSSISSLTDPLLSNHNYRVAFIAFQLARRLTYNPEFLSNVIVAALLHDIGLLLLSPPEDIIIAKDPEIEDMWERRVHLHAEIGYRLLKNFPIFLKPALTIRYHHMPYKEFIKHQEEIPYASQIIHIADRIDVFVSSQVEGKEPYGQIPLFLGKLEEYLLKLSGKPLDPKLCKTFLKEIAPKEAFWFELFNGECLKESLKNYLSSYSSELPLEAFFELSQVLAYLIDFKSSFTATHSSGVSQTAVSLASLFGFTSPDLKMMKVAGLLHDIGKVAIPHEILEKPGRLSQEEMSIMKSHVYHSYKIISKLDIDRRIVEWAAYHHETLDGNGYPFKLKANELPLGSRIMAVADIYTALKEDRPYKKRVSLDKTLEILNTLAKMKKIDRRVLKVLKNNLGTIETSREIAQQRAQKVYNSLREIVDAFV